MDAYAIERRRRPRVSLSVPVVVGQTTGRTRDLSADAVSFEIDGDVAAEGRLRFAMLFLDGSEGPPHHLHCEGAIVRATRHGARLQLVVRLEWCDLELLRSAQPARLIPSV